MFENLKSKFQIIFDTLRRKGKLNKEDIEQALREIKITLLEADVDYRLVKKIIEEMKTKALDAKVLEGLTPTQQIIKIVQEHLINLLGNSNEINLSSSSFTTIMLVGLNGSGKTTTTVKLAKYFKEKYNYTSLLVTTDVTRPAALEQLKVLGKELDLPVIDNPNNTYSSFEILKIALEERNKNLYKVILIDTAGRMHIDEELMRELINFKKIIHPDEILLIADAITGQEAVNIAKIFDLKLNITGIILTKMDGDARGGAVLSMRAITNKPIKFLGISEKLDGLEFFHAKSIVNRILNKGDILSLIEKIGKKISVDEAKALEEKLRKKEFNFNDLLIQFKQIEKLGSLSYILDALPGSSSLKDINLDGKEIKHFEAIINSMTKEERENPEIINSSRKKRIADGSGNSIQTINQLLKRFKIMQKLIIQTNHKNFLKQIIRRR